MTRPEVKGRFMAADYAGGKYLSTGNVFRSLGEGLPEREPGSDYR
jgi:hypothetical protein